eukprot:3632970-Amphidinium_carterae.1
MRVDDGFVQHQQPYWCEIPEELPVDEDLTPNWEEELPARPVPRVLPQPRPGLPGPPKYRLRRRDVYASHGEGNWVADPDEAECASGSASSSEEGENHVNRIPCVKALPGQGDGELGDLPESAASLEIEQLSFKQSGLEMPVHPAVVEKTWTRTDHGVKRFVASKDGGPRWEKVWKRATYNLDNGELIAEELVSDMTKKDLNRPLPEKVRNIRTVLYYRTTEKSDIEDKVEKSRGSL